MGGGSGRTSEADTGKFSGWRYNAWIHKTSQTDM